MVTNAKKVTVSVLYCFTILPCKKSLLKNKMTDATTFKFALNHQHMQATAKAKTGPVCLLCSLPLVRGACTSCHCNVGYNLCERVKKMTQMTILDQACQRCKRHRRMFATSNCCGFCATCDMQWLLCEAQRLEKLLVPNNGNQFVVWTSPIQTNVMQVRKPNNNGSKALAFNKTNCALCGHAFQGGFTRCSSRYCNNGFRRMLKLNAAPTNSCCTQCTRNVCITITGKLMCMVCDP